MTMNEVLVLALAGVAGFALGAVFFGGLWWTVQKAVSSRRPALLFLGSLLLRMSITLAGFYAVGHADWQRLLACLFGFVVVRLLAVRLTRRPVKRENHRAQEMSHAP
jgi:F1F0 ATPase subunit 2